MIREKLLLCSKCKKDFVATDKIFYKDNFNVKNFSDVELICDKCIDEWQKYWQIKKAEFFEDYQSLYVNIELENGDSFKKIDCSALDDIVALSIDIPLKAQQVLYEIYKIWYNNKVKDLLKECSFTESFMKTTFTCQTYGGDVYENIAFRFNSMGILETQEVIPDEIKKQVIEKWKAFELSNMFLNMNNREG